MMDKEFEQKVAYIPRQIDAAYVCALVNLVNACFKNDVKIDKVFTFQNGWQVTFDGFKGDAICHDHSYGSPCYGGLFDDNVHTNKWVNTGKWETMGFPWDGIDVSTHTSEWLGHSIGRLLRGDVYDESWEDWDYWMEDD